MHQTLRVLRMVRFTITHVNEINHWRVQRAGCWWGCAATAVLSLPRIRTLHWLQPSLDAARKGDYKLTHFRKKIFFLRAVTLKYPNSALCSKLWQESKLKCIANLYLFRFLFCSYASTPTPVTAPALQNFLCIKKLTDLAPENFKLVFLLKFRKTQQLSFKHTSASGKPVHFRMFIPQKK